jgi:hypothetical protein
MRWLLALLLIPALSSFQAQENPPAGAAAEPTLAEAQKLGVILFDEFGREIFFAVLEGLYNDGVDSEVLQSILRRKADGTLEHFVWTCPICMPAFEAMSLYSRRESFQCFKIAQDTFGEGLAPDTRTSLIDGNLKVRQETIDHLVRSWVERRLDKLRLTPQERHTWSQVLAERRKIGMTILSRTPNAELKSCPFCDGAAGACPIR